MNQDAEHLRLLSIFHYVVGALTALFSSLFIFHLVFGLMMMLAPDEFAGQGEPPPPGIGLMFVLMGGAFVLGGWALAASMIAAGRFLRRQRHYLFCLIVAGLSCMLMPFGTILGVFTIVVLMRPSVKASFNAGPPSLSGSMPADWR